MDNNNYDLILQIYIEHKIKQNNNKQIIQYLLTNVAKLPYLSEVVFYGLNKLVNITNDTSIYYKFLRLCNIMTINHYSKAFLKTILNSHSNVEIIFLIESFINKYGYLDIILINGLKEYVRKSKNFNLYKHFLQLKNSTSDINGIHKVFNITDLLLKMTQYMENADALQFSLVCLEICFQLRNEPIYYELNTDQLFKYQNNRCIIQKHNFKQLLKVQKLKIHYLPKSLIDNLLLLTNIKELHIKCETTITDDILNSYITILTNNQNILECIDLDIIMHKRDEMLFQSYLNDLSFINLKEITVQNLQLYDNSIFQHVQVCKLINCRINAEFTTFLVHEMLQNLTDLTLDNNKIEMIKVNQVFKQNTKALKFKTLQINDIFADELLFFILQNTISVETLNITVTTENLTMFQKHSFQNIKTLQILLFYNVSISIYEVLNKIFTLVDHTSIERLEIQNLNSQYALFLNFERFLNLFSIINTSCIQQIILENFYISVFYFTHVFKVINSVNIHTLEIIQKLHIKISVLKTSDKLTNEFIYMFEKLNKCSRCHIILQFEMKRKNDASILCFPKTISKHYNQIYKWKQINDNSFSLSILDKNICFMKKYSTFSGWILECIIKK